MGNKSIILSGSISRLQKLMETLALISEIDVWIQNQYEKDEYVRSLKYLGVLIYDQWDPSREIKCRIEMARDAFSK